MDTATSPESARTAFDAWRTAAADNAFDDDPFFRQLLKRLLGGTYGEHEPRLREVAQAAGNELDRLVTESNRDHNLPTLRCHDADGRAIEEVIFHPTYHAVGTVFWSSGVLAVLAEPGRELLSGAIAYLLDQHGEAGHACPVACTAGAIKLLQRLGTDDQKSRYLPRLLDPDYRTRLHAAQFVTEIQGGSDVGSNAVTATPEADRPGWYRISGEKWFCSVADAGLFVVSARTPDAAAGTHGLGLFLLPRTIDGAPNGFRLRRLKWKLGTRSMATGEIEFDGALAEAIGPVDHGFRNLVGIVLDTSRVHNGVAACGIMRRSFVEARCYAEHRRAFDRSIIDYPAVQETLARMKVRAMAAAATTFRILDMSDRCAAGEPDEQLLAARRIAVMINKYWTALGATAAARDGIEILGGNGTIEDFSALPRLYRDAIVVESWEGTHNTLCAQVLRDFAGRDMHRPWLELIVAEIDGIAHPSLEGPVARARSLYREVAEGIDSVLAADAEAASARIRGVVDSMCRLTELVTLCTQAVWDFDIGSEEQTLAALELYRLEMLDGFDAGRRPELLELRRRLASHP